MQMRTHFDSPASGAPAVAKVFVAEERKREHDGLEHADSDEPATSNSHVSPRPRDAPSGKSDPGHAPLNPMSTKAQLAILRGS